MANSGALLVQHYALVKVKKARKCREELQDAKGHLGVAQVATSKERDDRNTESDKASKFQAAYEPKMCASGMRLVS